jgi:hypothetical protein
MHEMDTKARLAGEDCLFRSLHFAAFSSDKFSDSVDSVAQTHVVMITMRMNNLVFMC